MTGLIFGAILLLSVLVWWTLAAQRPDETESEGEESRPRLAITFLAFAPALLFASVVVVAFYGAPAGEYRVALEAVEFDLAAGSDSVSIGGGTDGTDADDIVIRDLPPQALTFHLAGNRVVAELPAELDHSAENPVYAAVRVDSARPFANSFAIEGQQPVTMHGLPFDVEKRTFAANGAPYPRIPTRKQELTENLEIPIGRNLAAETMTFPLRFWARPTTSLDPVAGTDGAPLGTFLSYDGGFFRRTLFATLTGDGTTLRLADGTVKRYQRTIAEITAGTHHDFALFRLDYSDPSLGSDSRSAAQERRSFRAKYDDSRLCLVFDTPDFIRLSSESIARLVKDQQEKDSFLLATRDPQRNAPVVANQMALSFPQLGPRVQNELYGAIRISDVDDCVVRVTSHMGTRCYASGDAFRLGNRIATILRITKMTIPWGVILTMLALAFFSATWLLHHHEDTIALIIVSAAELLLAVRLLIAFEGGLLDPGSASALWESLAIFALLPFILRAAWVFRRGLDSPAMPPLLAEAVAVITLIAIALTRANAAISAIVMTCTAVIVVPLAIGWLAPPILDWASSRRSMRWLATLFAIIAAVRVSIMLLLGWKERISMGGADLALTVLYLPVVFLFFAIVWERYRQSLLRRRDVVVIALMGFILTIAIPFFVKDSGSALVHLPAIVLLFALPLLARRTRMTWVLAAPLLAVVSIHAIVPFVPYLHGPRDAANNAEYRQSLASETEASRYLAKRLDQSTNQLRLMSHLAPHQLEEAGTSKAEGLVMQRRMLDRYGGRGVRGAGYLNVPLATFRDTHLNDNLSAIHILAPFGLAGGLGVLAVIAAIALLPLHVFFGQRVEETPESAIDQRSAIGILALWTFSIAGLYMFAANVGLVLFTGKNVYLLAAASKSDAIEGGMLLLLALLTLVPPSPETAASEESR